jgi:hypothetical protein
MNVSTAPAITCSSCGKQYECQAFFWDVYADNLPEAADKLAGYKCESCGVDICSDCGDTELDTSWWSGFEKTTCPHCGNRFGPLEAQLKSETDEETIDTFRKDQENYLAGKMKRKANDWFTLLYGFLFSFLGFWIYDLGEQGWGVGFIVLGIIGILTGIATFASSSPVVKIFEALDTFALAILIGAAALSGMAEDLFDLDLPVWVYLLFSAFLLWSAYDSVKQYMQIRNRMERLRRIKEAL